MKNNYFSCVCNGFGTFPGSLRTSWWGRRCYGDNSGEIRIYGRIRCR